MRGARTWAAGAIAAGCVVGAVATARAVRRRTPVPHLPPPSPAAPRRATEPSQPPFGVRPRFADPPRARRGRGMWATSAVAVSIVLAAATVVGIASTVPSPAATVPVGTPTHQYAPGERLPHLAVPHVRPLTPHRTWRSAQVLRPVVARRRPGGRVAARLPARTPEHTANIVLLTKTAMHRGRLWARVRLPVLPNGTQGWVRRTALGGYTFVDTHLVVGLHRRRMTLFRAGRAIFRAPVG